MNVIRRVCRVIGLTPTEREILRQALSLGLAIHATGDSSGREQAGLRALYSNIAVVWDTFSPEQQRAIADDAAQIAIRLCQLRSLIKQIAGKHASG